jgi:hypothetical protein
MAYDSGRQRVVLFGGRFNPSTPLNDTWEWDGNTWTSVTPAGLSPSEQDAAPMAYDAVRAAVMYFNGSPWEWDGGAWTLLTSAGTGPTSGGAMACDTARGRIVLFDQTVMARTYEWDGTTWNQVTVVGTSPSARIASMAYDSARGRTALFGGQKVAASGPLTLYQDTWEWDGAAWRDTTPSGPKPVARRFHAMAYDSAHEQLVLFGGMSTAKLADTWIRDVSPGRQPAIQFDAVSLQAGIAASAITGLHVRALAGGTFTPASGSSAGATLLGWSTSGDHAEPGAWSLLATNGTGVAAQSPYLPAAPASLIDWRAASADEARRFLIERDGQLSFQVRPSGTAGPDPGGAQVALDYIEVRVRYAAP